MRHCARRLLLHAAWLCSLQTIEVAWANYLDLIDDQPEDIDLEGKEQAAAEAQGFFGGGNHKGLTLDGQHEEERAKFAYNTEHLWNVILKHASMHAELVSDVVAAIVDGRRAVVGVADKHFRILEESVRRHAARLFRVESTEHWQKLKVDVEKLTQSMCRKTGNGDYRLKLRPGYNPEGKNWIAYTYRYCTYQKHVTADGPYSVWIMQSMADLVVSGANYDPRAWAKRRQSQTMILIHEAAHCVLNCEDHKYSRGWLDQSPLEQLNRAEQFSNADNWAYFVESVVEDLIRRSNPDDPEYANKADTIELRTKSDGKFIFDMPNKSFETEVESRATQQMFATQIRDWLHPDTCTKRSPKDVKAMDFPPVPYALQPREIRHQRQHGITYELDHHIDDSIKLLRFLCMKWETRRDPDAQ
ncbi:unnamed protein product [Amoebophrya sp. A120]|nr:unnamed protein product [Amoebophrya sp. A120]|eukprot:GSA120T00003491001.1